MMCHSVHVTTARDAPWVPSDKTRPEDAQSATEPVRMHKFADLLHSHQQL